jgi:hypothetical protein
MSTKKIRVPKYIDRIHSPFALFDCQKTIFYDVLVILLSEKPQPVEVVNKISEKSFGDHKMLFSTAFYKVEGLLFFSSAFF